MGGGGGKLGVAGMVGVPLSEGGRGGGGGGGGGAAIVIQ